MLFESTSINGEDCEITAGVTLDAIIGEALIGGDITGELTLCGTESELIDDTRLIDDTGRGNIVGGMGTTLSAI